MSADKEKSADDRAKRYKELFLSTFQLSACTFGGGFVIVPLMREKFVRKLNWIDEEEMLDLTAIAQSSPGPIAVNAAILVGYHVAGIPGAAMAMVGTVLPPFIIISIISLFYIAFRDSLIVRIIMSGMLAGVAAVITNVVIDMVRDILKQRRLLPVTVLILAWLIWPHFVKNRARCGACIHSTFRANVVLMGIPVLTNMYGEEGALVAAMALPFVVILSNIGAVTVFTAFAPESSGARLDPRKLLLSIAKNPFIIAILLGLAAQLSGISFPPFASKSIDYLADMSTPLALLAVGGQFDPKKAAGNLRLNLTICTLRLVVIPAVVIAVAAALGFRGPELAFIFVVVGSPSAVSGAALAKVMGSDHQLTGEVTLMTSLLSAFTFFIAFTLLRSVALI